MTVRTVPEIAPPHELIHKQPVPAVGAVAQEAQQVWVGQPLGDGADLRQELRLALLALHAQPLHCNLREVAGVEKLGLDLWRLPGRINVYCVGIYRVRLGRTGFTISKRLSF
jgi:hypothetical protein